VKSKIHPLFGRKRPKVRKAHSGARWRPAGGRNTTRLFLVKRFHKGTRNRLTRFQKKLKRKSIGRNPFPSGHMKILFNLIARRCVLGAKMRQKGVFKRIKLLGCQFLDLENRNQ